MHAGTQIMTMTIFHIFNHTYDVEQFVDTRWKYAVLLSEM